MRDSSSSVGRSLGTLLVVLIAFVVFAAFFVALDMAAGIRMHPPVPLAGAMHAPAPSANPDRPGLSGTGHASGMPATPAALQAAATAPIVPAAGTSIVSISTTLAAVSTAVPTAATAVTSTAVTSTPGTPEAPPGRQSPRTPSPADGTALPMPTPVRGMTPPRYGTLAN